MKSTGKFVISLDFELNWGVFDVFSLADYEKHLLGAREVVLMLLERFQKHQLHATWGVVGFLFYSNKRELLSEIPEVLPKYQNPQLSAYHHIPNVGENEEEDPFHFGSALIKQIKEYPHQEIATHTLSHYYCHAKGQTKAAFLADIKQAIKVARQNGIDIKTIIFPRNQTNPDYLSICAKYGLTSYRGNENHWLYKSIPRQDGTIKRAIRLLDSYINISGHHVYSLDRNEEGTIPQSVPSSRFLRPYSKKLRWLEPLKMRRIKASMTKAAKEGKVYHLWWHPHNFGYPIAENMKMLDSIISHFEKLKSEYGMESCHMGEVYGATSNATKVKKMLIN